MHGIFEYSCKLKLISPAIIGCGENTLSDTDLIRDSEGSPFVPSTSFTGALRSYIMQYCSFKTQIESHESFIDSLFGYAHKDANKESAFVCSDLKLDNETSNPYKTRIRDGIRIDPKTGIVEDKKKYDYEVLEPGAFFQLRFSIRYNDEKTKQHAEQLILLLNKILPQGKETYKHGDLSEFPAFRIGAKTNSGFGKIASEGVPELFHYNFSVPEVQMRAALDYLSKKPAPYKISSEELFTIRGSYFYMCAHFDIKNSIIVRSYSDDPTLPDAVHFQSNGKNVLPGTSIKGAIRARVERILKTVFSDKKKAEEFSNSLFGWVDDKNNSTKAKKGRIIVEEAVLQGVRALLQTRIKIDRFTGGSYKTALFDGMPLFSIHNLEENILKLEITVHGCTYEEAGLLLFVLKDLWTGDLPIGGEKSIGRGVLSGIRAFIHSSIDKDPFTCRIDDPKTFFSSENKEKEELELFVLAFIEKAGA